MIKRWLQARQIYRPYLLQQKWLITMGVILMLVTLLTGLYLPVLNRPIFDEILPGKDVKRLLMFGGIILLISAISHGSMLASRVLFHSASQRLTAHLRGAIYRKLTRVSSRNVQKFLKGGLQDIIIHDVPNLQFLYVDRVINLAKTILEVIGAAALMCYMAFSLMPITAAYTVVSIVGTHLFNKRIHTGSQEYTKKRSALLASIFEMLGALDYVRLCTVEERECKRFQVTTDAVARSSIALEHTTAVASSFFTVIDTIMPFVVFLYGIYLMIQRQLLLGELMAFSMYFSRFKGAVSALTGFSFQWQRCKPSLDRVQHIMELPEEREPQIIEQLDYAHSLELVNAVVSFNGREVLSHVNVSIPKGSIAGVVGPNGSGKTTLLKVLSGNLETDKGQLVVDGNAIQNEQKPLLRCLCGFVAQNGILMNRTIRETVSFRLKDEPNDDWIYQRLSEVGLDNLIKQLPKHLDTMVGELGSHVSGGELQRLAIARELAYEPKILFLDEATTSIDAQTEEHLLNHLRALKTTRGLTIVFVTHYLRTLKLADIVFVMESGHIVESGMPDNLHHSSVYLKRLFASCDDAD